MTATSRITPAVPFSERSALSVRDTCARLGVGRTTIYKLLGEQKLESIKIGARRVVLQQSIDRFIDSATA